MSDRYQAEPDWQPGTLNGVEKRRQVWVVKDYASEPPTIVATYPSRGDARARADELNAKERLKREQQFEQERLAKQKQDEEEQKARESLEKIFGPEM